MLAITRAFALATLVAAAAAQSCAVCPGRSSSDPAIIDASGQTMYLVAASNSGPGTPTFCGYNHDKTHNWPEVFCYYSPGGLMSLAPSQSMSGLPPSTSTEPCSTV